MGYGAIIGAIGSLVSSGISAYGASKSGKQAGKVPQVQLSPVSLPSPGLGTAQYISQEQGLTQMEQTAGSADEISNAVYQKMLTGIDPGLINQIKQISNIATSNLQGIIPQDVQDQIQRATAQQAMAGGYGGTQMARNLTTRDLGTTSAALQQIGIGQAGTAAQMSAALNPSFTPISSLLFTPSQLLARQDQASYYNTDIKNQQAIMNSGNQLGAAIAASQGTLNTSNALAKGVSSFFGGGTGGSGGSGGGLLGGIMNLFGNQNNNPNFSLAYGDYQAQQMGYSSYDAAQAAGAI